jgi:hypothetical protein
VCDRVPDLVVDPVLVTCRISSTSVLRAARGQATCPPTARAIFPATSPLALPVAWRAALLRTFCVIQVLDLGTYQPSVPAWEIGLVSVIAPALANVRGLAIDR